MSTHFSRDLVEEWISQAEAARLRRVTRQAISRLVRRGRIRAVSVAGRLLVSRADALAFEPQTAGRPKKKKPR